ncbi:MAG: nicotinate-nucleotide--dimethylbenzimidazole phosphoribosyltransferase [Spirochaetales bacterium]|nr:nicotinate-nucleotide--dimethylbenzimidazole phosphoribosyltransferase [Spirochaetales bacterium]
MTEQELLRLVGTIGEIDAPIMNQVRERWDSLTKPPHSLGKLEDVVVRLGGIQGSIEPSVSKRTVLCFAADHGVVAEGVSPSQQVVTAEMVRNFLDGGAAISVLSECCSCDLKVFNAGMVHQVEDSRIIQNPVSSGTGNMMREKAMTRDMTFQALSIGYNAAVREIDEGRNLLLCGEMGVGNTTSASAIYAAVTGIDPARITGTGAGLPPARVQHKVDVIRKALALHNPDPADPVAILCAVGGFELAAMCGVMLAGAVKSCAVMVDGFISGASALLAMLFHPRVKEYLIFSHQSGEEGYQEVCRHFAIDPLVNLNMCLGEGTGAVMVLPLIDNALSCYYKMATFAEAGVTEIDV